MLFATSPCAGPPCVAIRARRKYGSGTVEESVGGPSRSAEQTSALLDALYRSAPVGLGFWDRDLRYVRVNEALAAINERAVEDHVGRTFREVVPQLAGEL